MKAGRRDFSDAVVRSRVVANADVLGTSELLRCYSESTAAMVRSLFSPDPPQRPTMQ